MNSKYLKVIYKWYPEFRYSIELDYLNKTLLKHLQREGVL